MKKKIYENCSCEKTGMPILPHKKNGSFHLVYPQDFDVLCNCVLFSGIKPEELKALLGCISSVLRKYKKGETIILAGEKIEHIGIVTSGSAGIVQEDILGRRSIITTVKEREIFGEGIVAAKISQSPVSVIACEDTNVFLMRYSGILEKCSENCVFHTVLISNLMEMMAKKLVLLNRKLNYSMMKTIREKIVNYLAEKYSENKSREFILPYNREELADYFSVDRSSLSRELSGMKAEGLIDYSRNKFRLKNEFFENI